MEKEYDKWDIGNAEFQGFVKAKLDNIESEIKGKANKWVEKITIGSVIGIIVGFITIIIQVI